MLLLILLASTPRISNATSVGGGLDCNGYSPTSQNILPNLVCADPIGPGGSRLYDNGWYLGHDEPSIQFFSTASPSSSDMEWRITIPGTDPTPSQSGTSVASFENYITFWFSLALCDPNSTPLGPCTPVSDSNTVASAGSAVLELQFYPPGINCSATQWCSALNIDSLECNFSLTTNPCNPNCM